MHPPPPPPAWRWGEGVYKFYKSLCWWGGGHTFLFLWGVYCWGWKGGGGVQVYHIKIFSFSFLYFSCIANAIALSILYIKHPNKYNNQQFNVKAILQKKIPIHVKLGVI